ncbi:Calx-beta domain-containing protein, partial [Roseivirga sp.]|uniref:Calx-beta domain-containing protein n=1 Tax=Roseivirga sp. TaxID=1964215 RepID=UPI003B8D2BC2
SDANELLLLQSHRFRFFRGGASLQTELSSNSGNYEATGFRWRSSDDSLAVNQDGNLTLDTLLNTSNTAIRSGGTLVIGTDQDAVDGGYVLEQFHSGTFTELMLYNVYLNTAQNTIVNNYLAAKYNLSITNDFYAYQASHPHDVAGIGRHDADNIHKAAMSDNILRIENASNLINDKSYMLFGHDNGAIDTWSESIGLNTLKISRAWRVDKTGDLGDVDVIIDTSQLPALPSGYTDYILLVDADGDFSSGVTYYPFTADEEVNEYKSPGLSLNNGDYLSIATFKPTLTIISENTVSGLENADFTFNVSLNFVLTEAVTIDVVISDLSTSDADYNVNSSQITIPAGSITGSYTLDIVDDVIVELDEGLQISLSNPSLPLTLLNNDINYTILNDDEYTLAFANSSDVYLGYENIADNEGNANPNILIQMDQPAQSDLVIGYSIILYSSNNAELNSDYVLTGYNTVTMLAGDDEVEIPVQIIDDGFYELPEVFILELTADPSYEIEEGASVAYYVIYNNSDSPEPTIGFINESVSVNESARSVSIGVSLDAASGVDVSVRYQVSGGTATGSGVDYTLTTASLLTIPAGDTEAFIDITLIHDILEEGTETIVLSLSNPDESVLGTSSATLSILDTPIIGITGPGGVGDAGTNKLWLTPGSINSGSSSLNSWDDVSGNSNNLSEGNGSASTLPSYSANVLNGYGGVVFDGIDDRLVRSNFTDFPTDAVSALYVNQTTDSHDGVISYAISGDAGDANELLIFQSHRFRFYVGNAFVQTELSSNSGNFEATGFRWRSSDDSLALNQDGNLTLDTLLNTSNTFIRSGGTLAIGADQDDIDGGYESTQFHSGTFTELILYNVYLNETQNIIVNNYLAAKYDLVLTANDVYNEDEGANGNFDYEVAGIGQISASDNHLEAKGSGIVNISNPRDIDNNEFLFWGHNNSALKAESLNVPSSISRRLERVWRVSQADLSGSTVDVGGVDLNFDLTGLGTVRIEDLVLLIDTDADFSSGATEVTGAVYINENQFGFTNVNLPDNSYFTLSTVNRNETPLPVELMFFDGQVVGGSNVQLHWSTAAEVDNSHFNIERSTDGIVFNAIGQKLSIGDTQEVSEYDFLDESPNTGMNYYRLKQNDVSGDFVYSSVISLRIERNEEENQYKVFPNPIAVNEALKLGYSLIEHTKINIQAWNSKGVILYKSTLDLKQGEGHVSIDSNLFKSGIVFIRITDDRGKTSLFKIIVR